MATKKNAYRLRLDSFGNFKIATIYNELNGNSFTVVPEKSGILQSLHFPQLLEFSLVDGYETPEALAAGKGSRSAFLLPFPNRLRAGEYTFEGKTHHFPIQEHDKNNALHGFRNAFPFELRDALFSHDYGGLTLGFKYAQTFDYYPFAFDFEVQMLITDENTFALHFKIKNEGKGNMPISFGWHPYFQLGTTLNQTRLRLPLCKEVLVDKNQIPTGECLPFETYKNKKRLGNSHFDTCFEVGSSRNQTTVQLESERHRLALAMSQIFQYFQLYTPPSRSSIALEPMVSNINAFQNGDGLQVLQPQEECSGSVELSLTALY